MRLFFPARPALEAAGFLAFLVAWTVLASLLLLVLPIEPLRGARLQGIVSAWAWCSYLLVGAPHPLPWPSFMGLWLSVWSWLPSLLLIVSCFLAALILGVPAWLAIHARRGLAR
ncbi:MAG: hypothetical protein EON48_16860 [Acetobacteraceae bacterium]|nr:MAG: hypothetical protein EON48_16860 [Acetobacteraceae bacterium]